MKKHWIKKCCMILTCLYLTGCGREEVPYLDTTQTQEQTVETERTEQKETLKSDQTVQVPTCCLSCHFQDFSRCLKLHLLFTIKIKKSTVALGTTVLSRFVDSLIKKV